MWGFWSSLSGHIGPPIMLGIEPKMVSIIWARRLINFKYMPFVAVCSYIHILSRTTQMWVSRLLQCSILACLMILGHTLKSSSGCWVCIKKFFEKTFSQSQKTVDDELERTWKWAACDVKSMFIHIFLQGIYLLSAKYNRVLLLLPTRHGWVQFYSFVFMFYSCKTWKRLNSEWN